MKINNRHMVAVPFTKSIFNTIRRKRGGERGKSEETKLKISKANKGKRIGCTPWNKCKKLLSGHSGTNEILVRSEVKVGPGDLIEVYLSQDSDLFTLSNHLPVEMTLHIG